jgi:hypothetical protein
MLRAGDYEPALIAIELNRGLGAVEQEGSSSTASGAIRRCGAAAPC